MSSDTHIIIPALLISAGITLYTGIQTIIVGSVGRRVPLYLAFAAACFCAALYLFTTYLYYTAASMSAGAAALQWQTAAAIIFFPTLFVFIALYTGQERYKPWLSLLAAVCAGLIVINFTSPYSLRFASLEAVAPLTLPWGEQLTNFSGTFSIWNGIIRILAMAIFAWALWRTITLFKRGERRGAIFLATYLLLQATTTIWGWLIDLSLIQSLYTSGFAFLGLVLLMSICMGLDLRTHNTALEIATLKLHTEIDERQKAESQIRLMASRDDLTGLANRISLHQHLSGALSQAAVSTEHHVMLMIDLDHFKTINEALGHDVGDEVLREVARRLKQIAAEHSFVARLGGDEFVMVIPIRARDRQEASTMAHQLAGRVTENLSRTLYVGERIFNVGVSIGAVLFPDDGITESDILRRADMALHRAKNRGRNTIQFYEPQMQAAADKQHALEKGIRAAVDNGELELYFQPQVDAAGKLIGAEALLRWHHPELGDIPPTTFIPVAEETGLIHSIGGWVLLKACDRLKAWLQNKIAFTGQLSINVSQWQLVRPDYVEQLGNALNQCSTNPNRLTLEITESSLLYSPEETIEKLKALRAQGLEIALDDFGTGYSSLAHLKNLPLDLLKIDKTFVSELTKSSDHPLAESIVAIGRNMGLNIIAEGVESEMQREILIKIGCNGFQGNLICPPLPEGDFLSWISQQSASPNSPVLHHHR